MDTVCLCFLFVSGNMLFVRSCVSTGLGLQSDSSFLRPLKIAPLHAQLSGHNGFLLNGHQNTKDSYAKQYTNDSKQQRSRYAVLNPLLQEPPRFLRRSLWREIVWPWPVGIALINGLNRPFPAAPER